MATQGVSMFAVRDAMCDVMCQEECQEERYEEEEEEDEEEEEGVDERILCSSFSAGQNVELYELPDTEALFMPTNMDGSQMVFKFKEVSPSPLHSFYCAVKCLSKVQCSVTAAKD